MPFLKKIVPIALVLLNALIIGYFSLKITGRQLPTDFVRPFLVSTLSWWAIYILLKAQCKKDGYCLDCSLNDFSQCNSNFL